MGYAASDLRFLPAAEHHIPFLVRLRNELADAFLSSEPATEESTRAILREMYVAEIEGEPVGAFSLYNRNRIEGSVEFGRFMVHPGYQNKGYGREMLKAAIGHAKAMGFTSVVLTVKPESKAALHLYCSEGFLFAGGLVSGEGDISYHGMELAL